MKSDGRPPSVGLLRIAGVTIALEAEPGGPPLDVTGAARAFVVDNGTPDIVIRAEWGDLQRRPAGRLLFDSGGVWQLHADGEQLVYSFSSPALGGVYRTARLDPGFRRGIVTLDRASFDGRPPAFPLEYPLDELLVINRVAFSAGVEVHGCGVVDRGGGGYLFAGQSGVGKSTIARLWAEAGSTIISDDRVILRATRDGITMHGTPWHGDAEFAEPVSVPLSRIFLLRQARAHGIVPLAPARAAALLFSCTFPVFHSPDALDRTLALLGRIVESVPVHALEFTPTVDVTDFVRRDRYPQLVAAQ